jgi:hypothetical protein
MPKPLLRSPRMNTVGQQLRRMGVTKAMGKNPSIAWHQSSKESLAPIENRGRGAVTSGHLGRIGLDLMPALLAPNDQPGAGSGSVAERHRWAGVGFNT